DLQARRSAPSSHRRTPDGFSTTFALFQRSVRRATNFIWPDQTVIIHVRMILQATLATGSSSLVGAMTSNTFRIRIQKTLFSFQLCVFLPCHRQISQHRVEERQLTLPEKVSAPYEVLYTEMPETMQLQIVNMARAMLDENVAFRDLPTSNFALNFKSTLDQKYGPVWQVVGEGTFAHMGTERQCRWNIQATRVRSRKGRLAY
ncbi:uncharacterized protein DEA37_0012283, partial [Paragonimus westermani]